MPPADWSPVDLVPGLWAAVLAVLLLRALRRWYDPVPAPVAAAFGIVLLILLGPVLFGGKLLLPLDNLRGQAPFTELAPTEPPGNSLQGDLIELIGPSISEVRAAWAAGRWPLWNGKVGAGMPLLADPQAQALQPLILVSSFLPWMRAAAVTAALRVFFALVFTFLWIRAQGLGSGPALAGAFAFGLGGFVLLWVGWPLANVAALLPEVLYAAARCRQSDRRRDLLLLSLTALALALGGHPETVVFSFGAVLAVLAAQTLDGSDGTPGRLRLRRLRGSVLALALAGLAAAPALLPTAAYLPQTLRATRIREGQIAAPAPSRVEDLARRLLPVAAPNAYGNSRFGAYWGLGNTNEDASGFVGTAALLAAVLSLGARRRFPLERLALGGAILCLIILATPSGIGRRLLLILSLALAYLAACALERMRLGEQRWGIWGVLLGVALLVAVIAWGILAHPDPADAGNLAVLRFGWLRWQMRFLGLVALLLVVGYRKRWMPPAVAGLIVAELLLAHLPANPPMPKRLAFPVTPAIRFLQENTRRTRMAALGRAFPPNLASAYGLSDARVYNPMAPRAYLDWLAPAVIGWNGESPELGAPRHPLYQRLGVRYLLTEPDARLPKPLRRAFAGTGAAVWEIPGPLPRLYIEQGVEPGTGRMRLQSVAADHLQAQVSLPREAAVRTSIYQDGGWRMLRNGVRCPPMPPTAADGPFVAARLPAGSWQVDLIYRPAAFVWGCVLAALALAAGAALFIAPPPTARAAAPLPGEP
jgi:hypothetical protein